MAHRDLAVQVLSLLAAEGAMTPVEIAAALDCQYKSALRALKLLEGYKLVLIVGHSQADVPVRTSRHSNGKVQQNHVRKSMKGKLWDMPPHMRKVAGPPWLKRR